MRSLEKISAPKWVKLYRLGKLTDAMAAEAGKYSRSRFLKRLGSGMEGVVDLMSHPSEGLAVRKIYDTNSKWFSPKVFKRKVEAQGRLGGERMARLYESDPRKFATWSEYVKPSEGGAAGASASSSPLFDSWAFETRTTSLPGVPNGLSDYFKERGGGLTDLHSGNIVGGKVVDFLPENMSGSEIGRLATQVKRADLVKEVTDALSGLLPGRRLRRWLRTHVDKYHHRVSSDVESTLEDWLSRNEADPDEVVRRYYAG